MLPKDLHRIPQRDLQRLEQRDAGLTVPPSRHRESGQLRRHPLCVRPIVARSVQLSKDGELICVDPIRHNRSHRLGAFADPSPPGQVPWAIRLLSHPSQRTMRLPCGHCHVRTVGTGGSVVSSPETGMWTRIKVKLKPPQMRIGWGLIGASIVLAIIAAWSPAYHYFADHRIPWRGWLAIITCILAFVGLALISIHSSANNSSGPEPERHQDAATANPTGEASGQEASTRKHEDGYPDQLQRRARIIKAILQMAIGLYALGWLVWSFYLSHHIQNCVPSKASHQLCYFIPSAKVALKITADALAAATAVQLAFTLFTPGPDEALDPVLLAIAAALLLQLGHVENFQWQAGTAIVLYSIALGILFIVRVFLAPDEDSPPDPWWWKKLTGGK